MRQIRSTLLGSVAVGLMAAGAAQAADGPYFNRVATYPVYANLPEGTDPATETVAEIITVTKDGMTLIHTDSPGEALGFVDITDPAKPQGKGRVDLGGEPTSVTVVGGYALVGVNTSESYVKPSGHVAVVDVKDQKIVATCDMAGQPDSVAASPDGAFLAVAIENERDEELNDGEIPQMPAGHVDILDLDDKGMPTNCDAARKVEMTGLAEIAPTDPEPEFVDINAKNVAVVTLQENNHLALIDLATGEVIKHFSAGTSSVKGIPSNKARLINGDGEITDLPREPDSVAWIDNTRFVTANEGDYKGGTRGFTIWNMEGEIEYDSGASMEHLGMRVGHYPAKRASKKGVEIEGAEFGLFGDTPLFFVNAERANFVAVFKDMGPGKAPTYLQVLPTNPNPEGTLAIPSRNLFVAATENDNAEDGVRATIGIFERGAAEAAYPMIVSADDAATGAPIGWGALSGAVGDPTDATILHVVSDSFYDTARIFTMDISKSPAVITDFVELSGGAAPKYDLEGITMRKGGGYWVVSEGNDEKKMDNLLIAVAKDGAIEQEIKLPEAVASQIKRFGFEGVASYMDGDKEKVVVAFQREWRDDPKGMVKIGVYDPASGNWGFVHYPLDTPENKAGGWLGLSEITLIGGTTFAVIERDNKGGPDAVLKQVTVISLDTVTPAPAGSELPVVKKVVALDLLPAMAATMGYTPDKVESLAITKDGQMIALTDNDGVDDSSGESQLLRLGPVTQISK
ncbi:MAG: esterase-like activity of phytase family protein [Rhodospirillum sp.]|nr:esterase-like activity of phytase family protein [Rhodospirillum sp.]MCF8488229.1 esterase-like activity of phytase family protein [Rhodospirillum sp.]MCF8501237.1 esterase-like activity of phytase family protein [Rhodospirillum sp.]